VNLEHLSCLKNQLTNLNVSDLTKLKYLQTHTNKLTELKFNNCPEISTFDCGVNCLTEVDISLLSEKLEYLSVGSNRLPPQDLSCFVRFVNLKYLNLGTTSFCGSLKPLRNLIKLNCLVVGETNIDSDLEYLPNSLKETDFHFQGSKKIVDQLSPFDGKLSAWRKTHSDKTKIVQQEMQIEELISQLNNKQNQINILEKEVKELTTERINLQDRLSTTQDQELTEQLTQLQI